MKSVIPEKTEAYRFAEGVFYTKINDVNFYVEDEGQEEFYHLLLKKTFPLLKIEKIIPLGGKPKILEHLSAYDLRRFGARVYILDPDFDLLLGTLVSHKAVFYLERYCIENYLVTEDGIADCVLVLEPKLGREKILEKLRLAEWCQQFVSQYRYLYAMFLFIQRAQVAGIENVSRPIRSFASGHCLLEGDWEKVEAYRARVCAQVIADDMGIDVDSEIAKELVHFQDERYFSGKHLLEAILDKLCAETDVVFRLSSDSRNFLLARKGVLPELDDYFSRIKTYLLGEGVTL